MIQMYIWSALLSNLNKCHKTQKKTTITDAEKHYYYYTRKKGSDTSEYSSNINLHMRYFSSEPSLYLKFESFEEV